MPIWLPQFPEALKGYSLKGKGKKAKKEGAPAQKHHDPQSPALHLVTLHRELDRYRWECPPYQLQTRIPEMGRNEHRGDGDGEKRG